MIELHYYPDNASTFPHMLLREIGSPFELRLVDRKAGAQKSAAYLALNPTGKIPVLVHDGQVIYETLAVGLHLADAFPEARLAPPPGAPARGLYYRWMAVIANTLQADMRAWFYPHEFTTDADGVAAAKAAAGKRLGKAFAMIAAQLGEGPWLLGAELSAADFYLLMMVAWGQSLPVPARSHPALEAHVQRLSQRPSVRETIAFEGLRGLA